MSHRYHPDTEEPYNDSSDSILFDDCEDCAAHARTPGLNLDTKNWQRAWERMLHVEIIGDETYRSDNEAALGKHLYYMYIALERYTVLDPKLRGLLR